MNKLPLAYRLLLAGILLGTVAGLLALAAATAPPPVAAAPARPAVGWAGTGVPARPANWHALADRLTRPFDWTAFPIVTGTITNSVTPAISDDYIVWADNRDGPLNGLDLYAYNRSNGQVFGLVTAPRPQDQPAISGDWVVYRQGTNIAQQYILQAIRISTSQIITIASGTANPLNPDISGNWIVWQDSRNYPSPSGYDIYAYNLATSQEVTVCTAPGNQFSPHIDGTRVVWQDLRSPPNGDIYGFDLTTRQEFTVTTAPGNQLLPDISGDNVVWQDFGPDPNAPDIYGANLTTHQQFPIAVYTDTWQANPRIDGPWVVWDDDRNGLFNKDIYAYHLPTHQEFPVIVDSAAQSFPAIWNGLAAWEDNRSLPTTGNFDIYAAFAPTTVPTPSPSPTAPPTSTPTSTPTPTATAPALATHTPTPTITATPAPTCTVSFNDVPVGSTFYDYVQYVACRGIVSGYPCGGPGEPCPGNYYRPNNNTTRSQITKMVVIGTGWPIQTPTTPTFEDVPAGSTFFDYIETAYAHAILAGYPCGGVGEPCVAPGNRPYFRPYNNTTRSQLTKIIVGAKGWGEYTPTTPTFEDVPVGNTFYGFVERAVQKAILNGYPCGLGPAEPCVSPGNRPYFRPYNNATRGQLSKILTLALQQP